MNSQSIQQVLRVVGLDRLPTWVQRIPSLAGADEEWQVVESTEARYIITTDASAASE